MVLLWLLYFLRAVCPVGLSSPICLYAPWNRAYHRLLRQLGLQTQTEHGLLTSWIQVYREGIQTTAAYKVCAVCWVTGAAALLLCVLFYGQAIRRRVRKAEHLYDRVYQTDVVTEPMRAGLFRTKVYLPKDMLAQTAKYIISMEMAHIRRKDDWLRTVFILAVCLQWWNPCIWLAYYLADWDLAMACDETVWKKLNASEREAYTQIFVNIEKKRFSVPGGIFGTTERHLQARADHLLYKRQTSLWKKAVTAFAVTVCFVWWFGLSWMGASWNDGAWTTERQNQGESLFDDTAMKGVTDEVICSADSTDPAGDAVRVELVIQEGTFQKEQGYNGRCSLKLIGADSRTKETFALSKLFNGKQIQNFSQNMTLQVQDYNEDGLMEVAIGQPAEVTRQQVAAPVSAAAATATPDQTEEKLTVQEYYLLEIDKNAFKVISDPIYVPDVSELQKGSMIFSYVQNAGGVLTVDVDDETVYYVWDASDKMYHKKAMTQQEIEERRQENSTEEGEEQQFTLTDDADRTVVVVDTKKDYTGSASIQDVILAPKGNPQAKSAIHPAQIQGYFCALDWVEGADETKRYAVLVYNGVHAQTFCIYDVKKQKIYYKQEDGNQKLNRIFAQYAGEEKRFPEDGVVVYSLTGMEGSDILQVRFAANAEDEENISGTYKYKISSKHAYDLSYSLTDSSN